MSWLKLVSDVSAYLGLLWNIVLECIGRFFRPLNCPRCWYLASLNYGFLSVLLAGWPSKGSRYDSNYEADQTVSIFA